MISTCRYNIIDITQIQSFLPHLVGMCRVYIHMLLSDRFENTRLISSLISSVPAPTPACLKNTHERVQATAWSCKKKSTGRITHRRSEKFQINFFACRFGTWRTSNAQNILSHNVNRGQVAKIKLETVKMKLGENFPIYGIQQNTV